MHIAPLVQLLALVGASAASYQAHVRGNIKAGHHAYKRQVTYGFPPASTDWRNEQRYAILSNDWGSTSFIPLLLALNANMTVLGLTSTTGNMWALQASLHALALLEHGNLSCIPVARGTNYPLKMTEQRFRQWTGQYGTLAWNAVYAPENLTAESLGGDPTSGDPERISRSAFVEGFPNNTYVNQSAAEFMIEQVFKHPGKVTIYSAGPLTNIALAIQTNASFAKTAKELVVMGGYVDLQLFQTTSDLNQDIGSDNNFIVDPDAAHIALTADFPSITIVSNVANSPRLSPELLTQLNSTRTRWNDLLDDLYADFFAIIPLWDETAAMIMAYPDVVVNSTTLYMDVGTCYESPFLGAAKVWGEHYHPNTTRKVNFVTQLNQTLYDQRLVGAFRNPKVCINGVPTRPN